MTSAVWPERVTRPPPLAWACGGLERGGLLVERAEVTFEEGQLGLHGALEPPALIDRVVTAGQAQQLPARGSQRGAHRRSGRQPPQ